MIYQHYKGARYLFLMNGLESTNGRGRNSVVVYVSLEAGQVNVRDREEFDALVEWPDGYRRPRFCLEGQITSGRWLRG